MLRTGAILAVAAALACGGGKSDAPAARPGAAPSTPSGPGAPDAGSQQTASLAAECDRAMTNMAKVMPGLVEGDEDDRRECMKFPLEVVRCLQQVKNEEQADGCIAGYLAARPPAPKPPGPDDGEAEAVGPEDLAGAEPCKKAIGHVRTLMPKEARDAESEASMIAECTAMFTKTDVSCLLAAKTLQEVDACALDDP